MKTVFISGSNGGIGRALVKAFAKEQYSIVAHELKATNSHDDFLNEIKEKNPQVQISPIYFDLTDSNEMKMKVKQLIRDGVSVDVLVNCAGIAHGGFFQMTSIDTIRKVFDVNFFSMLELTQYFIRPMVKKKTGCIINLASVSGLDSRVGNCAYGTSKAAVIAWTKTLASEVGSLGLRVNAIAPSLTDTDMAKQMENKAGFDMINDSVMNRLVEPREIADIAVFLASDKASIINGQVIRADGGSKK